MSNITDTLTVKVKPFLGATAEPAALNLVALEVTKVEGPFDKDGNLLEYAEPGETYDYCATLNIVAKRSHARQVNWAVGYDSEKFEKQYLLFSGGSIQDGKVHVSINIGSSDNIKKKITEKFRIYAYIGRIPNAEVFVEMEPVRTQKYVVIFFIGGAGDKKSYYGFGPTRIVEGVSNYFDGIITHENDLKNLNFKESFYKSFYLGYNEVKGNEDIENYVLSKIPDKENTAVYIIGHSLGGWNGAHLSQILTDNGYYVDLLITLDPVGTTLGVALISDIYWEPPKPKSKYWINISTDPKNYEIDDKIADAGGQWQLSKKDNAQINHISKHSHREALAIFKEDISSNTSASDMLLGFIRKYVLK